MLDLYVLADISKSEILTPLNKLPENWLNVSGLNFFDDEKLSNLSWAGHKNLGWFPSSNENISSFTTPTNWMDSSKANIKSYISSDRKEKVEETLTFNGNRINLTNNTRTSLSLRVSSLANQDGDIMTAWKFVDGYVDLTKAEIIDLLNFVSNYIQSCFDAENMASSLVDDCNTLDDINNLTLDIVWPDTSNS